MTPPLWGNGGLEFPGLQSKPHRSKAVAGKQEQILLNNITSHSAIMVTQTVSFTLIRFYCLNQGSDTEDSIGV